MSKEILVKKVKERFGEAVCETVVHRGEVTHLVARDSLIDVLRFLREEPSLAMDYPVDVTAVDLHPGSPRFEVVYHLLSTGKKHRIRVKTRVEEGGKVPSATAVWKGADWYERETYDMFGIVFEGHPDLRRIFLADDWEGFPLRKDYPLRGYRDAYNPYGEEKK